MAETISTPKTHYTSIQKLGLRNVLVRVRAGVGVIRVMAMASFTLTFYSGLDQFILMGYSLVGRILWPVTPDQN